MLRDFVYNNGEYSGGRIYNPSDGKEYKAFLKLKDPNSLTVRGYVGFSVFWKNRSLEKSKRVIISFIIHIKKSPFQGMFLLRRLIEIFCLSETDALAFLGLDKVFLGF